MSVHQTPANKMKAIVLMSLINIPAYVRKDLMEPIVKIVSMHCWLNGVMASTDMSVELCCFVDYNIVIVSK